MLNQSRSPDTSLSPATSLFFSSGEIYSRDNHLSISVNSLYPKDSFDIQTASLTWTYYAWHNLRLALQNSTTIADSYTIFPGTFGLYTLFVLNLCFTLFRYSLCFALHSRLLDYLALGFLPSISCKWLAISNSLYSCAASFPVLYLSSMFYCFFCIDCDDAEAKTPYYHVLCLCMHLVYIMCCIFSCPVFLLDVLLLLLY